MRKSLMTRFLLAYFILFLCTPVLVDSLYYISSFAQASVDKIAPGYGKPAGLSGFLSEYFQFVGLRLSSIILPAANVPSFIGLILTVGLALAGAALFAGGILKQYRRFCARADAAAEGGPGAGIESAGVFRELGKKLNGLVEKRALAEAAQAKRTESCNAAQGLLEAARAQVEVFMEAGLLAEGSAENVLIESAVDKIQKAERLIGRQD